MAKDPAFLFYTGDFSTGTQFFSNEEVGKYVRLLMAQHQHGHLSPEQVNFICNSHDKKVLAKFKQDSDGNFFNERLEKEILRRQNYSASRGNNRLGKLKIKSLKKKKTSNSYVNHMETKTETKTEEKNKKFEPPKISDVECFFLENGFSSELGKKAWAYYNDAKWHDSKGNPVRNWKQKMRGVWFKDENKTGNPKIIHHGQKMNDL